MNIYIIVVEYVEYRESGDFFLLKHKQHSEIFFYKNDFN